MKRKWEDEEEEDEAPCGMGLLDVVDDVIIHHLVPQLIMLNDVLALSRICSHFHQLVGHPALLVAAAVAREHSPDDPKARCILHGATLSLRHVITPQRWRQWTRRADADMDRDLWQPLAQDAGVAWYLPAAARVSHIMRVAEARLTSTGWSTMLVGDYARALLLRVMRAARVADIVPTLATDSPAMDVWIDCDAANEVGHAEHQLRHAYLAFLPEQFPPGSDTPPLPDSIAATFPRTVTGLSVPVNLVLAQKQIFYRRHDWAYEHVKAGTFPYEHLHTQSLTCEQWAIVPRPHAPTKVDVLVTPLALYSIMSGHTRCCDATIDSSHFPFSLLYKPLALAAWYDTPNIAGHIELAVYNTLHRLFYWLKRGYHVALLGTANLDLQSPFGQIVQRHLAYARRNALPVSDAQPYDFELGIFMQTWEGMAKPVARHHTAIGRLKLYKPFVLQ